jgi:hypothetical protein
MVSTEQELKDELKRLRAIRKRHVNSATRYKKAKERFTKLFPVADSSGAASLAAYKAKKPLEEYEAKILAEEQMVALLDNQIQDRLDDLEKLRRRRKLQSVQ